MSKYIFLIVMFLLIFCGGLCYADAVRTTNRLTLSWEAVTQNSDGTECDDLAGYAIYRSRESNKWDDLIGKEKAYRVVSPNQSEFGFWCHEPGTWFWMVRAFDKTLQFSDKSNQVESFVDLTRPSSPKTIIIKIPGDLDNDGDVDGDDLAAVSINFGNQ